jgi:hypothetical protein
LCSEEGLPSWASSSVIAARAAGNMGVVAAWSRYAETAEADLASAVSAGLGPAALVFDMMCSA